MQVKIFVTRDIASVEKEINEFIVGKVVKMVAQSQAQSPLSDRITTTISVWWEEPKWPIKLGPRP